MAGKGMGELFMEKLSLQQWTSVCETEPVVESSTDIGKFKSVVDDLFKKRNDETHNETINQSQREFADVCANYLQKKSVDPCSKNIEWTTDFCKLTVAEHMLELNVCKGRVKTSLTVNLNCSCLADEESFNCMSRVFDNLKGPSEPDFENALPDPDWENLLSYWKQLTSSFRREGFSNFKLIFCGLNGEEVVFKNDLVKTTTRVKTRMMVHLNKQHEVISTFLVDEINKRTLANIILTLCGNEGAGQTTEQAGLRRLLHAFMTKIDTDKTTSFTDVKLSLYSTGQDDSSFHILAGNKDKPKEVNGLVNSKGDFHIQERPTESCIIS